jgi:hypothetical protein
MKIRIAAPEIGQLDVVGQPETFKQSGDYAVLSMKSNMEGWDSYIALEHRDIIRFIWLMFKSRTFLFIITGLKNRNKPKPLPYNW